MCPNCQLPANHPKHEQSPTLLQYHFHPQYIRIGHQKKTGTEQSRKRERERLDKIIKEQQQKIGEARRRKGEEENAPLCKLCLPKPINTKPNSPLVDPFFPALEEKEENKRKGEEKDCATDYYPHDQS